QEVFMWLMREGGSYDETRGSVHAFLLGVARNYVLRRLKQERSLVTVDCPAGSPEPPQVQAADDQLEDLLRNEAIESVQRAILSLPERYREVVVLCELQEMSYAETARVLNCAIGTVRSRLHRARVMLIDRLSSARNQSVAARSFKSTRCFA